MRRGRQEIAILLRQFESQWDTQILATMVCVLSSASRGGMGALLPQGEENVMAYERYLTHYAGILHVWGAYDVCCEVLNHLEVLNGRHATPARKYSSTTLELAVGSIRDGRFAQVSQAHSAVSSDRHGPPCKTWRRLPLL